MPDTPSVSIVETLRDTFDLAALRHEGALLRTGQDWEAANEIKERYEAQSETLEATYTHEYDVRVQQEYARPIEEARAPDLTHKPVGSRGSWLDQLRIKAEMNVRDAHSNDVLTNEKAELREREGLEATIERRDDRFGDAKQDFARATDRRDGTERRQITR